MSVGISTTRWVLDRFRLLNIFNLDIAGTSLQVHLDRWRNVSSDGVVQ
ncbi:hypothetical protein BVRB_6g137910 [Beta vulgaris subsp. vulgaris]|nr:hypothetical protein BVRB_6g137910 [Beta vulgaris subsp. vulgaris]